MNWFCFWRVEVWKACFRSGFDNFVKVFPPYPIMETGYWNFPDGEHFTTSSLYGQSLMEDTKHSLLDIDLLPDDFTPYESVQHFERVESDLWGTETELNGDIAVLPIAVTKSEGHSDEDFHKVLSDWQEHVGSMQASDTEDMDVTEVMDVKDIVGLDIPMPRNFSSEHLPESIFEETSLDCDVKTWHPSESANSPGHMYLATVIKEEYSFDLENFLDCDDDCEDDDENIGLKVVEEDIQESRSRGDSCLEFQEESEGIFGNVDLPIMQSPKLVSLADSSQNHLLPTWDSVNINYLKTLGIKTEMVDVTIKDEIDALEFQDEPLLEDTSDSNIVNSEVEKEKPEMLPNTVQVKSEENEDCIDVETVSEQMPVLEAGDLKSLLEQFEASEAVNSSGSTGKQSVLDSHLFAMAKQPPSVPASSSKSVGSLSHQNIKDSLPKEVIDRIKASGRKKVIPVIPAMPSKKAGRAATRMQDAGVALSRNKLLKIVNLCPSCRQDVKTSTFKTSCAVLDKTVSSPLSTFWQATNDVSGNAGGESVQLDHDYCCSSGESSPTKSFYHSDASEYCGKNAAENLLNKTETVKDNVYSKLPDYIVLAPQAKNNKRCPSKDEECWEKNAKKDSGLESGDVSDASEETITPPGSVFTPVRNFPEPSEVWKKNQSAKQSSTSDVSNVLSVNGTDIDLKAVGVNITNSSKVSSNCKVVQNQTKIREITMVSVLKKCQTSVATPTVSSNTSRMEVSEEVEVGPCKVEIKEEPQETKKRKINLEQYRSRLKELDKVRPSDVNALEVSCVDLVNVDTCVPVSVEEKEEGNSVSERTSNEVNEVNEQTQRPNVCSVEIQTQLDYSNSLPLVESKEGKTERRGRSNERRRQHYRSRRVSSSSSSGSSSSSRKSRSSHRLVDAHSRRRRRRSKRNSSGSTSGTRSRRLWSRSRSSSRSSSYSSSSSRSRSRSRSRRSHIRRSSKASLHSQSGRSSFQNWRPNGNYFHGWRRSRSPIQINCKNMGEWPLSEREKLRQVEERRVVYVGRIEEGTTKADLRRRFEVFGNIVDISVHFREHGDNYGFVTFQYKDDAYNAVEHGNDDPQCPKFDLCFGGRRAFCKTRYADLDGIATHDENLVVAQNAWRGRSRSHNENSFDLLLREAQAKLRKRNNV